MHCVVSAATVQLAGIAVQQVQLECNQVLQSVHCVVSAATVQQGTAAQ